MKKLTHYGAAGMVTGSCHLLTGHDGRGTLVDFGMFQGTKEVQALNRIYPAFNAQEIDNVILTHAHLDHCGRLPLLFKMGFTGDIYMTPATRDLAEIVMFDSAKIASKDPDVDPMYTDAEVEQVLEHTKLIGYNQEKKIGNYHVTFKDAGHLLGSAFIELVDRDSDAPIRRITFSGDIGNTPDVLLNNPAKTAPSDVVVLESTYGDRLHPNDDKYKILKDEIDATMKSNAVLMIPAFSLERTQLILFMIKKLKREGKIGNNAHVYLDSPMAIRATAVYRKYRELYNDDIIREFQGGDPFTFPGLTVSRSHKQSLSIEKNTGPRIIIAGSGMMSGGRIVSHAARYLPDEINRLLFVGYQGVETMGRAIREGAQEVEIDGETIPVNAHLSDINNMSAHADQKMLMDWLRGIEGVKKVVLVHGEDGGPRETLAALIKEKVGIEDVDMPYMEEEVDLS